MPDKTQEAVETIRDIHIPDPVSSWPPPLAILASLVAALLIAYLCYLLWKNLKQKSLNRIADERLESITTNSELSPLERVKNTCQLLREFCISYYPRTEVASMTGKDWIDFLNQATPDENLFTNDTANLVIEAPYRNKAISEEQAAQLIQCCRNWLKRLPAKRL